MKRFAGGCITMFLLMSFTASFAQKPPSHKQPIFKNVAARIPAGTAELEKAFSASEGQAVTFNFHDLQIKGTVLSSVRRYENLHSVVVKASAEETVFSISKRIEDDGTITFVGRILNDRSTDGYELKKHTNNTYTFIKIQMEELIQDF